MNFDLTEDQTRIRDAVREFAETRIAPGVVERERHERFPSEVVAGLAEMGILGRRAPQQYAGAGAAALSFILTLEELARICASTAVIVSVNNSVFCSPLWKFGSEEQKRTILSEVASGRALGAYALTEPQSGSDAANQKTRAVRDGDAYVLNGAKAWITNAGEAKWYLVMAMTEPAAGTRGITAFLVSSEDQGFRVGPPEDKMGLRASRTASFLVPSEDEGFRVAPPENKMGLRASRTAPVFFDDVRLPAARRVGQEGEGFTIAMKTLDHSRIGIAAQGIGISRACYDASVEYAATRETFGKKLAEHEIIAFQIADMRVQIEASKVLTYRAAVRSEIPGVRISREASMAKV